MSNWQKRRQQLPDAYLGKASAVHLLSAHFLCLQREAMIANRRSMTDCRMPTDHKCLFLGAGPRECLLFLQKLQKPRDISSS